MAIDVDKFRIAVNEILRDHVPTEKLPELVGYLLSAAVEAQPTPPEGDWRLVPVEPTRSMVYAAGIAPEAAEHDAAYRRWAEAPDYVPVADLLYRSMVRNAPEPPKA